MGASSAVAAAVLITGRRKRCASGLYNDGGGATPRRQWRWRIEVNASGTSDGHPTQSVHDRGDGGRSSVCLSLAAECGKRRVLDGGLIIRG